jgi:hypothetical protein
MKSVHFSEEYARVLRECAGAPLDALAQRYVARKFGMSSGRSGPELLFRIFKRLPASNRRTHARALISRMERGAFRPRTPAEEMRGLKVTALISRMQRKML